MKTWFWIRRHNYLMKRFQKLIRHEKKMDVIYGNSWDTSFHSAKAVRLIRGMRRCNWHLGAFSSLLFFLSAACLPSVFATPTPLCNQNGDLIYLQQERGDVLCRGHQTWFTPTSSAAPTFNPKSAACPRRVAVLTLSGEENEHILNIRETLT